MSASSRRRRHSGVHIRMRVRRSWKLTWLMWLQMLRRYGPVWLWQLLFILLHMVSRRPPELPRLLIRWLIPEEAGLRRRRKLVLLLLLLLLMMMRRWVMMLLWRKRMTMSDGFIPVNALKLRRHRR